MKKLLNPFIAVGIFFTVLMFLNMESMLPIATKELKKIDIQHDKQKQLSRNIPTVQSVKLEDNSTVMFYEYEPNEQYFYDAFWIRSFDEIYRIKFLYPYEEIPFGNIVEHMVRNEEGDLIVKDTYESRMFSGMKFNQKTLSETIVLPEEESIGKLWKQWPEKGIDLNEKESQIVTTFYYKMALPWLCLLAVLGPAPFCLRFNRQQPVFFIYAYSIFGLVAFYLLLDAGSILGKRQVIDPLIALGVPLLAISILIGWNYTRLVEGKS